MNKIPHDMFKPLGSSCRQLMPAKGAYLETLEVVLCGRGRIIEHLLRRITYSLTIDTYYSGWL